MAADSGPSKTPVAPPAVSDEALHWIVKLHSGAASDADRKEFRKWRDAHPDHEAAAQEAEALWDDATDLHEDPRTGIIRPGQGKKRPSRRNILVSAGLVVASASGLWATGAFHGWASDYATGVGETRVVTLPDGSRITLNAQSAINLKFSPSVRAVALVQGQAFFEVAADKSRTFQVTTKGINVTALGTAFDVNTELDDDAVAISVTEHAVTVTAGVSVISAPEESVKLIEGQTVVVDARGHFGPVKARSPSVMTAWRTGMYIAEDRRLGEVVAALRPYHTGWIAIRGDIATKLRVNAVLNLRTPDESLDALANGLPISVRRISPYLVVISKIQ